MGHAPPTFSAYSQHLSHYTCHTAELTQHLSIVWQAMVLPQYLQPSQWFVSSTGPVIKTSNVNDHLLHFKDLSLLSIHDLPLPLLKRHWQTSY